MIADASKGIASVRRIIESSEEPMTVALRDDIPQTVARLNSMTERLAEDLPTTVAQLRGSLRRLDDILMSGQGDMKAIYRNIRELTKNLRVFTETINRYPSQVLFGEPPPQKGAKDR